MDLNGMCFIFLINVPFALKEIALNTPVSLISAVSTRNRSFTHIQIIVLVIKKCVGSKVPLFVVDSGVWVKQYHSVYTDFMNPWHLQYFSEPELIYGCSIPSGAREVRCIHFEECVKC